MAIQNDSEFKIQKREINYYLLTSLFFLSLPFSKGDVQQDRGISLLSLSQREMSSETEGFIVTQIPLNPPLTKGEISGPTPM